MGHSEVDREGEVEREKGTGTETSTPQSLRFGLRSQSPFDGPRLSFDLGWIVKAKWIVKRGQAPKPPLRKACAAVCGASPLLTAQG